MKRSFLILSLLIVFCQTVQGLVPRMIGGTHDESITTLKVDEDGRLCYSSLRGLYTYDGTESSDIITGINVLDFFPEKGHGYWIATPSFIGHMSGNGTLERFNTLRYGNKKKILDIDLETLLFTNDDGVYIMDKESGETISSFAFPFIGNISLLRTSDGRIWIGTDNTLLVFDKNLSLIRRLNLERERNINSMVLRNDVEVLLGTPSGLLSVSAQDYSIHPWTPLRGKDILSMFTLKDDSVLCLVEGTGIVSVLPDRMRTLYPTDVQFTNVSNLFAIDEGHIWLSWGRLGLFFITVPVPEKEGPLSPLEREMDGKLVRGLAEDSHGRIWILAEGSLYVYDKTDSSLVTAEVPGILSGQEIRCMNISSDDRLWGASGDYFAGYRIDGKKLVEETVHHSEGNLVNKIFETPGGEIHFEFYNQQYKYSDQTGYVKLDDNDTRILASSPEKNFLLKANVNRISVDKDDLHMGNVSIMDEGIVVAGTLSSDGTIWCLCSDGTVRQVKDDMSYTEYSLPKWRKDKNNSSDYLFYSIEEDQEGNIWVGSTYGLVKIVPGKTDSFEIFNSSKRFDYYDVSMKDRDGNLYFAFSNGLTVFSPQTEGSLVSNRNVPLMIEDLLVNNVRLDMSHLETDHAFPYYSNNFIFKYSDINYDDLRIPYEYLLEGYDKDWQYLPVYNATTRTSRFVSYSNLPAGEYTFRIKPDGSDGQEQSFSFRIKQKPWLSAWAISGYILFGLLVIFILTSYLVHRRKQRIIAEQIRVKEELDKAKMELFTNLSHELRTPLTLISAPLHDLRLSESISGEDRKKVEIMGRNVQELLDVTNQLLRYDKIENEPLLLRRHDILNEMRLCKDAFSEWAKERRMTVELTASESIVFSYDSVKISRVLSNLLSNAIKYSYDEGTIKLDARIVHKDEIKDVYPIAPQGDTFVEITVSDNGRGIPFDRREKVFERHVRDESISDTIPGFGIGLNYVRQLVREHGGDIVAEANSPVGSVFRFILPVGEEGYEILPADKTVPGYTSAQGKTSPEDWKDLSGISILVVEDHAQMREYVEGIFSPHVKDVHSCPEAHSALEYMSSEYVDIVISDVMMPGMSGYQLCEAIKNDSALSSISVVLLTAKNDTESRVYGLNIGADAYVGKPFESEYILAVVQSVARARSHRRDILLKSTSENISQNIEGDSLMNGTDRSFLEKLYSLLDERIQEEEINVNGLLKDLGMSRTGFYMKVKSLTGKSPIQYINDYRMNKSLLLLRSGKYSIKEIAYMVGYQTRQSFTARFKSTFGYSPTEFQQHEGGE